MSICNNFQLYFPLQLESYFICLLINLIYSWLMVTIFPDRLFIIYFKKITITSCWYRPRWLIGYVIG